MTALCSNQLTVNVSLENIKNHIIKSYQIDSFEIINVDEKKEYTFNVSGRVTSESQINRDFYIRNCFCDINSLNVILDDMCSKSWIISGVYVINNF